MTDRNKFEQMLEALINEETEKAKEIFHDIVVEKSRDIYESLLESDFEEEPTEGAEEEEMPVEGFGEEEEGEEEDGPPGDEEGDMDSDFGDEEGDSDEEMDDSEQTDRILDLEAALEELKAEFEELMAGEEGEEHMGGDEFGGDATDDFMGDIEDEPMDEFSFEDSEEEEEIVTEYVNKVSLPKHGDNGVNTKSIVAKPNNMGGTTANIARGGEAKGEGTKGGLLNPSTKEENFGNINVPGANVGKKSFKKQEPGHGAEKKGKPEQADNKKSLIGGK
jgi:hypothetical protein